VERTDGAIPVATPLRDEVEASLMRKVKRPSRVRARALALAAVRETFEETGLLVGTRGAASSASPGLVDPTAGIGVLPDLGALHFIARAITPPRRPRRFDTRFFAADASTISHRVDGIVGPDSELVELVWLPLTDARKIEMAGITQVILEELQARIAAGLPPGMPVPFYQMINRHFRRELL
jgi:8-oxo-dGTP pyrophosphatase MutT (NUDIX family)